MSDSELDRLVQNVVDAMEYRARGLQEIKEINRSERTAMVRAAERDLQVYLNEKARKAANDHIFALANTLRTLDELAVGPESVKRVRARRRKYAPNVQPTCPEDFNGAAWRPNGSGE